jgi:hypothetical protein
VARKYTYQYVYNYIKMEGYRLLTKEYINANNELKIECSNGHIIKTSLYAFRRNQRNNRQICVECLKNIRLEAISKYLCLYGYKLLSNLYVNMSTKIKIQCPKNHKYDVLFGDFKYRDNRCPTCDKENRDSQGVRLILEYLQNNNINFRREYTFDDCKGKRALPFDFAVFKNNQFYGLIEFQGKQHYDTKNGWSSELIIKNDKIKLNYCESNNIKFLAIPYNGDHIIGTVHNFIQDL